MKNTREKPEIPALEKRGEVLQVKNQVVYFHSSEKMPEIEDESVQLVITSPPYGSIKDYDHPGQIGFHDDFDEYMTRLARVWKECYRVLQPGCRLVINGTDI